MEPPGHSPPLRAPPATSTTGANMVAEVRDGVSGGDASPKEHAQRRSDGDPTAGGQPVPGAAAATDNTEVADLLRMMLLSQATAEKNRADAEARLVARLTALEERQLAAENGSAAVLGGAQSTEGSVTLAGSCDGGGSPGVAVAGNETEAHDGGHVPPAFEDATGKHHGPGQRETERIFRDGRIRVFCKTRASVRGRSAA